MPKSQTIREGGAEGKKNEIPPLARSNIIGFLGAQVVEAIMEGGTAYFFKSVKKEI